MDDHYYNYIEKIDNLLKEQNVSRQVFNALFKIIRSDRVFEEYFFRNVKNISWFDPLNKGGWFSPEQIKFDEQGNAFFWNAVDYLERVSEQVVQNQKYGEKLIKIIDSVVQYSQNKKQINNYHIWWYCVKILNNIPSNIIIDNLSVEKFHLWLFVWTIFSAERVIPITDIGKKLLPKFLSDDFAPEYKYAEAIIDVITEIRAGGKSPALTKGEEAVLAWDSYWVKDAFRKNYQLIGQKCSSQVVFGLADRLKKVLEHERKNYYVNIEIGDAVYRIKVSRVPVKGLQAGEIGFQDGQYECVVKQFSQEQLKGVARENTYLVLYDTEPQNDVKQFGFTAVSRDAFMKKIKESLPRDIEWISSEKFEEKLGDIFNGLYADYSRIWFKSLEGGGHDHERDAKEVLTIILRDVLLAKCEGNKSEGERILDAFFSDQYQFPIFRRFVLLCIDKYWEDYRELFDKFFEMVPNALEESDFEVELHDVLRTHNQDFSPQLKEKLKELIDSIPEYYVKEGEKLTAYWQYKWLSPLRDNPDFSALYEEAKQKAEPKDGKPYEPERAAIEAGWVSHKSPITKEDILEKPIPELVKYLSEFKGADFWHGTFEGEPDKEGLADALRAAVQDDPKKFTDQIDAFWGVDYFYLHKGLFSGFKDAWKASKELDWEKVFNFALKYFKRDKDSILKEAVQAQGKESGNGKYIYLVEDIVDLIADGCRDDTRAFDPKYFDKAEEIFDLVFPFLKGEKHPDTQRDPFTYALNTTLGRTIMAYVSFSLRVVRATQQKEESWGHKKYERFFNVGIEACIWFGRYLAQMKYLDEPYTKEKIEFFAQKASDDFEWQMFMEGYLTGGQVYQDLYRLMRPNYLKGLEIKIFEERVNQRLVSHITLGYLYYEERLEEENADGESSLFWKMLTEAGTLDKGDRWLEAAGFLWSHGEGKIRKEKKDGEKETSEEIRKKILEFWAWTYSQQALVKENLGDEYNSFLERMAKLTIFLDTIDEEKEKWLLLCTPHVDRHHDAMFFIESLAKFDDEESIKRIGKIFLKVLENTTPTFRQENVESIVRRIYDKGDRNDAEAICNTYGRRGIHFLKSVWEEYQKKKNS